MTLWKITLHPFINVVLIKCYCQNIIVVKMMFTQFRFKPDLKESWLWVVDTCIVQRKNHTKDRMKYWTLQRCCKDIFCYGGLLYVITIITDCHCLNSDITNSFSLLYTLSVSCFLDFFAQGKKFIDSRRSLFDMVSVVKSRIERGRLCISKGSPVRIGQLISCSWTQLLNLQNVINESA